MEIINCGAVVAMTSEMVIYRADGELLGLLSAQRFPHVPTVIRSYEFADKDNYLIDYKEGFQSLSDETLLNTILDIENNDKADWAKGRPQFISGSDGDWTRLPRPRCQPKAIHHPNGRKAFVTEIVFYDRLGA